MEMNENEWKFYVFKYNIRNIQLTAFRITSNESDKYVSISPRADDITSYNVYTI